jgi:hypothetical protein
MEMAFQILVGSEEISQGRWVSVKARDLLAYFITSHVGTSPT